MQPEFERFYAESVADLYGYLSYRLVSRHEAEPLMRRIFESASRGWRAGREDPRGSRVWLLELARSAVARRVRMPESEDAGFAEDLAFAFRRLQRSERSVLALRFGADLTAAETALVLGIGEDVVSRRLSRALRRMRTDLGEAARAAARTGQPAPDLRDELEPDILPRQLRALEALAGRLRDERPTPDPALRAELDALAGELSEQVSEEASAGPWRWRAAACLAGGLALFGLAAVLALS